MRNLIVPASLLALAVAVPAAAQAPLYGSFDLAAGFLPDPFVTGVTAGGAHDASSLPIADSVTGSSCAGYVNAGTPDIAVNYTGGSFLRFGARSEADVTLIVALPDGTYRCNDDRWGLNPGVDVENPPAGTYNVWVGVYGSDTTAQSAVLVSELQDETPYAGEGLPQVEATGVEVNFLADPLFGTLDLAAGFTPDPAELAVTAGGSTAAADTNIRTAVGGTCTGSINTSAPDARVNYTGGSFLRFYVESEGDTTLLINGPDGTWFCNDDSVGFNPMIDFTDAPAGQYDVFVGVFGEAGTAAATLKVTELMMMQPGM